MPKLKFVLSATLVILLLFIASSGQTATTGDSNEVTSKVIEMQGHSRRFLTEVLDYDYGGANSKHDPRRKPGNGH